jgi:hypothetical protein
MSGRAYGEWAVWRSGMAGSRTEFGFEGVVNA